MWNYTAVSFNKQMNGVNVCVVFLLTLTEVRSTTHKLLHMLQSVSDGQVSN